MQLKRTCAPAAGQEDWQLQALCRQTDPEAFFPERGESAREAKRVCGLCEVRAECLGYALAHDERFGIWGGLTERELRRLKKDRAAARAARVAARTARSAAAAQAPSGGAAA
jgi:WhiB family redox-sensing transcriptional regulator